MEPVYMLTIRKRIKNEAGTGKILYQRILEPIEDCGHAWYDNLSHVKGDVEIILEPYVKGMEES